MCLWAMTEGRVRALAYIRWRIQHPQFFGKFASAWSMHSRVSSNHGTHRLNTTGLCARRMPPSSGLGSGYNAQLAIATDSPPRRSRNNSNTHRDVASRTMLSDLQCSTVRTTFPFRCLTSICLMPLTVPTGGSYSPLVLLRRTARPSEEAWCTHRWQVPTCCIPTIGIIICRFMRPSGAGEILASRVAEGTEDIERQTGHDPSPAASWSSLPHPA